MQRTLTISLVSTLAACSAPVAPPAAPGAAAPLTTVYNCGGRRALVTTTPETARVQIDNQSFDLKLTRSASGARYEASGEAGTVFWNKGERALLTVRGRELPECTQAKVALPLRATGNEPSWLLEVTPAAMTLTTDFGARRVVTAAPTLSRSGDATVYTGSFGGGELVAAVVDRVCLDTMSGMPHPYTVSVRDGAKTLRGCGGAPATLLTARAWLVKDIGGRGVVDRSRATLEFDEAGRVSGSTGCNSFAGRYALSGEGLAIREVAATRKACAAPLMDQEARLLAALGSVQGFDIAADGALRLLAAGKPVLLAR
jgi:heat shock protein HslJ/membrane-bound inhibitor of C-type lysozyme